MKAYGIEMKGNHFESYTKRPEGAIDDVTAVQKPWERPVLEDIGRSAEAIYCDSPEKWNNDAVLFEIRNGIAYVTINNPVEHNALDTKVAGGLHDAWHILRKRTDIRICVLTGTGRFFSSGGSPDPAEEEEITQAGSMNSTGKHISGGFDKWLALNGKRAIKAGGDMSRDLLDLATLPQFVILCMNGSAMGTAVGLMACCDYVVAVKTAHCVLSDVKLGTVPAVIVPHLTRTMGEVNAMQMVYTAENVNMQRAVEYGLVQRTVSNATEFPIVVKELAAKIQQMAPGAIASAKRTIMNTAEQPVSENLMQYSATEYRNIRLGNECVEGFKALCKKQKPWWYMKKIDVKEE